MRLYNIDDEETLSLEEFINRHLSDAEELEDDCAYREHLDECYGSIEIFGEKFSAAEILENCAENQYYNGRYDWAYDLMNEYIEEAKSELPRMAEDESIWIANWNITLVPEDVKEDETLEELV